MRIERLREGRRAALVLNERIIKGTCLELGVVTLVTEPGRTLVPGVPDSPKLIPEYAPIKTVKIPRYSVIP